MPRIKCGGNKIVNNKKSVSEAASTKKKKKAIARLGSGISGLPDFNALLLKPSAPISKAEMKKLTAMNRTAAKKSKQKSGGAGKSGSDSGSSVNKSQKKPKHKKSSKKSKSKGGSKNWRDGRPLDSKLRGRTLNHAIPRERLEWFCKHLSSDQKTDLQEALGWRDLGWDGESAKLRGAIEDVPYSLTLLNFLEQFAPNLTPAPAGKDWHVTRRQGDPKSEFDGNSVLLANGSVVFTPRSDVLKIVDDQLTEAISEGGLDDEIFENCLDGLMTAKQRHLEIISSYQEEPSSIWFCEIVDRCNFEKCVKEINEDTFDNPKAFEFLTENGFVTKRAKIFKVNLHRWGIIASQEGCIPPVISEEAKEKVCSKLKLDEESVALLFESDVFEKLRGHQLYHKRVLNHVELIERTNSPASVIQVSALSEDEAVVE